VVWLGTALLPAEQGPKRFDLDDFSRVARVADPQIAPDGRSIAVVISRANLDENRYEPELTLVEIATGARKSLVSGQLGVTSPRWSPDGNRIAFLANGATPTTSLQVYIVPSSGGSPQALTSTTRGVQQLAWSPDSRTIAYATQDEPEKKPGPERFNLSFEVLPNTNMTMTAAVPPTHLWVVPAAGGDPKRLTAGSWSLPISRPPGPPASAITWTKDGAAIVFSRTGGGEGRGAGAGVATPVQTQTPQGQGRGAGAGRAGQPAGGQGRGGGGAQMVNVADGSFSPLAGVGGTHPQFAPTGDAIVFMNGGNASVLAAPGGTARNLTQEVDRNLARALWLPDGKTLIVGGNDDERVSLWLQPLDAPARKLDLGDLSPSSSFFVDMHVGRNGGVAFTASSPSRPTELYYMASPGAAIKRLTDVNASIEALPLGRTETIEWKNDNFRQNGMLTYPPDFAAGRKYPLVLLIHGGPRAASMRTFSGPAQLMAAKGWLVFQPNYRGSDNLGNTYANAIRNDAGEGPGRDVIAGINAIKARGIVDESRMAVSGWSYGGYMTTWMLGHYDIWKAAVTGASVTSQLDQYNLSDGAGGGRGNNSPWVSSDAMERMRAQSPITYASKIKAPTLILHNVGDYRVTITQSYQLYHALLDNGVPTQFIAYPIPGHNATDPVHQRDVQRRWIGWLEQYLNVPAAGGR